MPPRLNIAGKTYGRLMVIKEHSKTKRGVYRWECRCQCGNIIVVQSGNLASGNTNSCGCYRLDMTIKYQTTHGYSKNNKNGKVKSEYTAWQNMKGRCYNPLNAEYSSYGGRGIKVCERWVSSFENFIFDMKDKPSPNHSIERIDVNGNYEPDNCCWATIDVQVRNKQTTHWIEYNGIRLNMTDWANKIGAYEENLRRMMKKKSFAECVNYYLFNTRKKPCNKKNII